MRPLEFKIDEGNTIRVDNREEASGGVWRWIGHRWMSEQNQIGDLFSVGCSVNGGCDRPKPLWVSLDKCHLHVQHFYDVCHSIYHSVYHIITI